MKRFLPALLALVFGAAPAFANVVITSPGSGSTVTTPARFIATATTTTCSKGVASMGIYVDNDLEYTVPGATMNATLAIAAGKHNAVVQEWDYCGGATKAAVPLDVVAGAGVWVTSPVSFSKGTPLTSYVATATTTCAAGVASMGVVVDGKLLYKTAGASLNTQLTLAPGVHNTTVKEWDNCGGELGKWMSLTVVGNQLQNLQTDSWKSWGQLAPLDNDCAAPCPGVTWNMVHGVKSPSISGNATQFNIGGTTPYSDALWYDQLIGDASTQGLPDTSHTLIPTLHNFTYDVNFYVSNAAVTQALEFDVNMFFNTVGMTFGTECRVEGGNEWDVWDNVNAHWVATGVPCHPIDKGWNHVTLQLQRGENNTLIFQSITLNGTTAILNRSYAPFVVPADWYGVVTDFQMDGNFAQDENTAYLDNVSFTYW
jgi:hypothetical protein